MNDKLLLPEAQVSVFQPRLAAWIGLNESILLQHVHYLAGKNDFGAVVDGVKWIRMTTEEWAEELPCFDPHTIRRALANLEKDALLVSRTFTGRSKWYRVDYELLTTVNGPIERLQSRPELRVKAAKSKHKASVQGGHIGGVSVQSGQLYLSKVDSLSVQSGQLPRPLPRPLSDTISPNGDSGQKPQEETISKKWNNANKKIVGDKFLELTQLKPPANKKTAGAWWGWLYEIFEMADRDPAETCRVMGIVVGYMRSRHTDITSPKSLINYSRVVASGQELAGSQNGSHQDQPRASPPKVGEIDQDRYQQLLQEDKP